MPPTTRAIGALTAVTLVAGGIAARAAVNASSDRAALCSHELATQQLGPVAHRSCVITVASAFLQAREHKLPADTVPLDPRVSSYQLSQDPHHAAGGAAIVRAALSKDSTRRIAHVVWVVDGDVAMVSYAGWTGGSSKPTYFVTQRFMLRDGQIWEILSSANAAPSTAGGGFPNTPVSVVTGPPDSVPLTPDYNSAPWCTVQIGEHGDSSLTPAQHRRCMIAIASTYVNAEENSTPGNQILFDPRFSRYSLGGAPMHSPSNSDLIRTQEGTYQGTYNRVIRAIKHREWTVDGNQAWIVYQGWLVASTTHPGFYVAERFTIRDGLIWNIMIAPVATRIP